MILKLPARLRQRRAQPGEDLAAFVDVHGQMGLISLSRGRRPSYL
jgi:hypothetical protein